MRRACRPAVLAGLGCRLRPITAAIVGARWLHSWATASCLPAHHQAALLSCTRLTHAHHIPGTELGGGYFSGSLLQPQAPSTFSTPTIGHRPVLLVTQPDGTQTLSPHGDTAGEGDGGC